MCFTLIHNIELNRYSVIILFQNKEIRIMQAYIYHISIIKFNEPP
jgi:hypothetical protein